MTLQDITRELQLEVKAGEDKLDTVVRRGYVSDLMSDVIANTKKGDIWITLQVHINIVAVASMKELSGIILINGRQPEPPTLEKAQTEGLPLFVSTLPAFEVAGRLHGLGLTGMDDAVA